jgi:hypothetical protein
MTLRASILRRVLSRCSFGADGWQIPLAALAFIACASVFFHFPPGSSADAAAWVQAVGSIGAILAAIWVLQRQTRAARASDEAETRAFVQAVREELSTFWEGYNQGIRASLKKVGDSQYLNVIHPPSADVFTIYNGSSSRVGKIADAELRRLIVAVYARFKGQLYSLYANNNLVTEHHNIDMTTFNGVVSWETSNKSNLSLATLKDYTKQLKVSDEELEKYVDKLLTRADAWLGVQKDNATDGV